MWCNWLNIIDVLYEIDDIWRILSHGRQWKHPHSLNADVVWPPSCLPLFRFALIQFDFVVYTNHDDDKTYFNSLICIWENRVRVDLVRNGITQIQRQFSKQFDDDDDNRCKEKQRILCEFGNDTDLRRRYSLFFFSSFLVWIAGERRIPLYYYRWCDPDRHILTNRCFNSFLKRFI